MNTLHGNGLYMVETAAHCQLGKIVNHETETGSKSHSANDTEGILGHAVIRVAHCAEATEHQVIDATEVVDDIEVLVQAHRVDCKVTAGAVLLEGLGEIHGVRVATVGVVAVYTELGHLEHQALVMDQDGAMCLAVIGVAAEGKFQVLDGHVGRDVHVMDGNFYSGVRNHAQLANNEVTHRTTGNVCLVLALMNFSKKANALPDCLRNVLFFNLHVPNVAKGLPCGNLHVHSLGGV